MKLSFEGVRSIALRQLADIEAIAKTADDYDEYEHQIGTVKACISAYHDALLGLAKGDVDIDEIKGFMFHGMPQEEIKSMPYCTMVIRFSPVDEQPA